jgi:hypothetical protein
MRSSRATRIVVAASAVAAACGANVAPAGAGRARAACGYRATYSAPSHHPRAERNWVVRVHVRPASLRTRMHYEFYFGDRRVATRYVDDKKSFAFEGHMQDAVIWPKRSIGIPLVFRVVLHNSCGTKHWNWAVKVRR